MAKKKITIKRVKPKKKEIKAVVEEEVVATEPVEPEPVISEADQQKLAELCEIRDGLVRNGVSTDSKLEILIAQLEKKLNK